MIVRPIAEPILDAEERFEGFENLMPFRVQNILLVSSLYDSFILREDGRLNELLIDESLELNLRQIPGITHVSSCAEALDLASSNPQFNLIVTNLAVGDMDAAQSRPRSPRARASTFPWSCSATTIARSRISSRAIPSPTSTASFSGREPPAS